MKRNLIYYVYPVRGAAWQWNVAQIKKFMPHFAGGKKLIVVAQGDSTEDASLVKKALAGEDVEVVPVSNDPVLWETRWFIETLERVASHDDDESTFYAHAKGVTKGGPALSNIISWTYSLYFLNLGCIDLIDRLLKKYEAVGAFQLPMEVHPFPEKGTKWYYSGTFFWLRHKPLFSKDWRSIPESPYGVECYPGRKVALEHSYDLAGGKTHRPYQDQTSRGDCEAWLQELIQKEKPV